MSAKHYEIGECLFESDRSRVIRAIDVRENRPVIIKLVRSAYPTADTVALVEREFEIARSAANEGAVQPLDMLVEDGQLGIVFEDFGGRPLSELRDGEAVPFVDALELACQATRALARVHAHQIVHRDVSPANLLWNRATGIVKLTDFGSAQLLQGESLESDPVSTFEGTLGYVSPEQTGRLNRPVDARSDLYSLGATLYELFVGAPPFASTDPLELIHAHLARRPVEPDAAADVPETVSAIIMTLLEKHVEDRYQTAAGVLADLERALASYRETETVEAFELRQNDVDPRLRIPRTLYGRDDDVARLRAAFRDGADRAQLLLVSGRGGVGKTALIQEFQRSLRTRDATFVAGKSEQFNLGAPYAPLLQAFRAFVSLVLSQDRDRIATWRRRILEGVGSGVGVLHSLLPEIAAVIGTVPPPEPVSSADARNRFGLALEAFVRSIATRSHPLVVFLDDLHWADLHTIELLKRFARDPDSRHLLLIGAFRPEEVDSNHPLAVAITQMDEEGRAAQLIELTELSSNDVARLMADMLRSKSGTRKLAQLCHAKTGGNPFFLRHFIKQLAKDELLRYEVGKAKWTWDSALIEKLAVTENVVDFMCRRIESLPEPATRAICAASCIGDAFDVNTLAVALQQGPTEVTSAVEDLVRADLIALMPGNRGPGGREEQPAPTYRFVHDRIRQAARALLDAEVTDQVHLRVGRKMRDTSRVRTVDSVFAVADHLNQARKVIDDRGELAQLAELNLEAGRTAVASTAFEAAFHYFRNAVSASDVSAWESRYETTLAIFIEGARAAYLSGDHRQMEEWVAIARNHATSDLDRVSAGEVRLQALLAAQRFADVLQSMRELLSQLGVKIPDEVTASDVEAKLVATISALSSTSNVSIASLPTLDDERIARSLAIQTASMTSAYLAEPELLPVLACNVVLATLEHGVAEDSAYAFSVVALVLVAINQIELAYETGQIAMKILERDTAVPCPRAAHVVNIHVNPFVVPLRDTLEEIEHVFQAAMQVGDLEYAGWSLHNMVCQGFYAGVSLGKLRELDSRATSLIQHHKQLAALGCATPFSQALVNLRGGADDPRVLRGEHFDEDDDIAALEEVNFRGARYIVGAVSVFLRFLFRDFAGAIKAAESAAPFADGATATQHAVYVNVYSSLARLGQLSPGDDNVASVVAEIAAAREQLAIWQAASASNHTHRLHLIDAEVARVENRTSDAVALYEQAIDQANKHRFLHERAVANELLGRFHLQRGSTTAGRAHIAEAGAGYSRWGAQAKVAQLEDEYPGVLPTSSATTSAAPTLEQLDLDSLFKASAVISSETRLEHLPDRILAVAIESAGATKGYLLTERGGHPEVLAGRDADENDLRADAGGIPPLVRAIAGYVSRTGQTVALDDARDDDRWQDERPHSDRPLSVFCAPILHQGRLSGIVYLENELAAGAFPTSRVRVLELLCTQAAISFENARQTKELRSHRDTLEDLVHERTRELEAAMSELVEANAFLDKQSTTDALTGLPNRRFYEQRLQDEWERARRFGHLMGVLVIDVDCFKAFNDRYGHLDGDECLRLVATQLGACLRRATDFVARVGGEEFVIVLPSCTPDVANSIADTVVKTIEGLAIPHEGSEVSNVVTVSVGGVIRQAGREEPSAEHLVAEADAELYKAKRGGRNRVSMAEPGPR